MDIREVGLRRTAAVTAGLAALSVAGIAGFGVLARADSTTANGTGTSQGSDSSNSSGSSGSSETSGTLDGSGSSDGSGASDGSGGTTQGGTTLGSTDQGPHARTGGS